MFGNKAKVNNRSPLKLYLNPGREGEREEGRVGGRESGRALLTRKFSAFYMVT